MATFWKRNLAIPGLWIYSTIIFACLDNAGCKIFISLQYNYKNCPMVGGRIGLKYIGIFIQWKAIQNTPYSSKECYKYRYWYGEMSKTINWCRKKGSCPDTFLKVMLYVLIGNILNLELCEDQNMGKSGNQSKLEKTSK